MGEVILQRVVFPRQQHLSALYYRLDNPSPLDCPSPAPTGRRSFAVPGGTRLDTDTYFNSFFEGYWRRHTAVGAVRLRLWLTGSGTLELCQRSAQGAVHVLAALPFRSDGHSPVELELGRPEEQLRQAGSVFFRLTPDGSGPVELARGEWVALGVEPRPVRLVAGYCTCNREAYLLRNVNDLCEEPDCAAAVARVVVVDQGTSKVRCHPDYAGLSAQARARLTLLEQGNFGGAGGFTRCILEAQQTVGATHVLLMDDDAVIEPESVLRVAAFQSLAKGDLGVGGQMLDMRRPTELYSTAAQILYQELGVRAQILSTPLEAPERLELLHQVRATYAEWWFFCFPLTLLKQYGYPLPLFIRLDDAEYGLRMTRAGLTPVMMPGVAIWHEPFYAKRRGWMTYYDSRNMYAISAIHFPTSRWRLAKTMFSRLVKSLLIMDYYTASLILQAIEDYRRGPEVLLDDPKGKQNSVVGGRKEYPQETLPRELALQVVPQARSGSSVRRLLRTLGGIWRGLFRRSTPKGVTPQTAISWQDEDPVVLAKMDVAAIDDPCFDDYVVARRARKAFWKLFWRGAWAVARVLFSHRRIVRQWQEALPHLTTEKSWRGYLGLDSERAPRTDERRRAA
jgi:galactofuranosylgalactofuranosylrhamnosyl-N-acetylglucosaminyl-diphospho-decaprenol beta-1,5/1,6-galactofuranosyltransferase